MSGSVDSAGKAALSSGEDARIAAIDIGPNSVRLVVYDGPRRIPFILFNEKVMAGLGASLAKTGATFPVLPRRHRANAAKAVPVGPRFVVEADAPHLRTLCWAATTREGERR